MKNYIIFFVLILPIKITAQINLTVIGNWDYTINLLEVLEAGNDFTGTYTSGVAQTTLSITKGNILPTEDFDWRIDVSKGNEDWHPDLQLYLKRTGDGIGTIGGTINGGDTYQELTTLAQVFFDGQKERTLIPIQYELKNVSVTIPAKTYYTTVIYTVTEL